MKIQELRKLLSASDKERLEKVPFESEYYPRAVKLLSDIYHLICAACNYYLFSTEDPFRSIGWEQSNLFELLVKKTFALGYTRVNIAQLLLDATGGGLSRESLHIEQELVLLGGLKTSDVKLMAIEEAKKLIEGKTEKLMEKGMHSNQKYYLEEAVNELCGMVLLISIRLGEPEEGINYYFKYTRMLNREITLYCALDLINIIENDDLWIKVYEYGVKKRIKPRDCLKDRYEILKKEKESKI